MKKILWLLTISIAITSCNNMSPKSYTASNIQGSEKKMDKEKETQAEEKRLQVDLGTVAIKSKLKDIRTIKEKLDNIPPKNNIINTVLFDGKPINSSERNFLPLFEIEKNIMYDLSGITFVLKAKILTLKTINFPANQTLKIKEKNGVTLNFDCQISYEPYSLEGDDDFLHIIICKADININDVNILRTIKNISSIVLVPNGEDFSFSVPKEFFEFLREI